MEKIHRKSSIVKTKGLNEGDDEKISPLFNDNKEIAMTELMEVVEE